MKVFFPNGTIAFPPSNGPHIHKYQLTKNLTALGHSITTFSLDENPAVNHVSKRPWSVLRAIRNSDVIYVRTGEGTSAATRMTSPTMRRMLPRHTAVIWEMNLDFNLHVKRNPRTAKQAVKDARDLRIQAERVDAAICVTDSIATQAREQLGVEHIYTIENGSDPEMFRPDLPKIDLSRYGSTEGTLHVAWIASESNAIHDAALVVTLAKMIEQRDVPIVIHAIGRTEALFPRPLPSTVVLHGAVSYLELPRYLASMNAGLVLYNIRYDGGSPLKLFDYMASGCVPFCTPGQGIEAVLEGSSAGFVSSWTAESLLDALESLRQEGDARERMATNGRALIERTYNWKTIAEKTDRVIRESVARRMGSSALGAERQTGSN